MTITTEQRTYARLAGIMFLAKLVLLLCSIMTILPLFLRSTKLMEKISS